MGGKEGARLFCDCDAVWTLATGDSPTRHPQVTSVPRASHAVLGEDWACTVQGPPRHPHGDRGCGLSHILYYRPSSTKTQSANVRAPETMTSPARSRRAASLPLASNESSNALLRSTCVWSGCPLQAGREEGTVPHLTKEMVKEVVRVQDGVPR